MLQMIFMRCGFASGGQESGLCLLQLCAKYRLLNKIQAIECYIESLPLVLKDKRGCFSQGETSTVQLPLHRTFALWNQDTCLTIRNHSYKLIHYAGHISANSRRHQQWEGDGERCELLSPPLLLSVGFRKGQVLMKSLSCCSARHSLSSLRCGSGVSTFPQWQTGWLQKTCQLDYCCGCVQCFTIAG